MSFNYPKNIGPVRGIEVGATFKSRRELVDANLHREPQKGIWGAPSKGAYSIVLSGGYPDDIDKGDWIRYTGEGGQDASTRKQTANQKFASKGNAALRRSWELGLPIRVIRAVPRGFRYDGLFLIERAYLGRGSSGFMMCFFELRRVVLNSDSKMTSDAEQIWQRIRRWAIHAKKNKTPIKTLQRGALNYITDVNDGTIGRRSTQGRTNQSRASRADIAKIWKCLQAKGETDTPGGVLYFAMALMVAALDEVEHVGDGVIRLVRRPTPISEEPIFPQTMNAETNHLESFPVRTRTEVHTAIRREAKLVATYVAHLEERAVVCRRRYGQLVCDIFIESRGHLIEAKADASRESVRMAIGQLFDYRRFEPTPVELGVLVPERPAEDLLELLEDLGIACIWACDNGFEDNRGGDFV